LLLIRRVSPYTKATLRQTARIIETTYKEAVIAAVAVNVVITLTTVEEAAVILRLLALCCLY
jgi:hypothetical protein